jgi:activator of HSP90 ATPase
MDQECSVPHSLLNRRSWLFQTAAAACGLGLTASRAYGASDNGIIRTAEAIHQEVSFNAPAKRIYEALTDASIFHKVELLSAAMKAVDVNSHPAVIHREPGGSFSLFGDYIKGRQIELVTDRLIVQAWRSQSWASGLYSIARFELEEHDSTTKLVFDHGGFPPGTADHLAAGWYSNYWEPLKKFLA